MAGEQMRFATFGDWILSGSEFMSWLETKYERVLVRSDFWARAIFNWPIVQRCTPTWLDRHEILLIPKLWPRMATSVSWSMPIGMCPHQSVPRVKLLRGHASCLTCIRRVGPPERMECREHGQLSFREEATRDLGACAEYSAAPPGPLPIHRAPVWWQDSDWPVAPWRYGPDAFDEQKLQQLHDEGAVSGEGSLRRLPIPPTHHEKAGTERAASPTKEGWIQFLSHTFAGTAGLDEFMAEAHRKAFTPSGVE